MQNKINFLRLYLTKNLTNNVACKLLKLYNNSIETTLNKAESFFKEQNKVIQICSLESANSYLKLCVQKNIKILCPSDAEYPKLLLNIDNYPIILHCKGNVDLLNSSTISVVGSRNAALQNIAFAKQITKDLVKNNYTTVSGLARGVDACVHENSLNQTIAVFGCGIEVVYPQENKKLYNDILNNNGLLISEFLYNQEPRPNFFSFRNRIIAGLSKSLVVIEANIKSGSLVTAKYAIEQGREIFSVPGHPFDVRMSGNNYLIKNGAFLLQGINDIVNNQSNKLDYFNLFESEDEVVNDNIKQNINLSEEIFSKLTVNGISIDTIVELMHAHQPKDIHTAIGVLELTGKVINSYGIVSKNI